MSGDFFFFFDFLCSNNPSLIMRGKPSINNEENNIYTMTVSVILDFVFVVVIHFYRIHILPLSGRGTIFLKKKRGYFGFAWIQWFRQVNIYIKMYIKILIRIVIFFCSFCTNEYNFHNSEYNTIPIIPHFQLLIYANVAYVLRCMSVFVRQTFLSPTYFIGPGEFRLNFKHS